MLQFHHIKVFMIISVFLVSRAQYASEEKDNETVTTINKVGNSETRKLLFFLLNTVNAFIELFTTNGDDKNDSREAIRNNLEDVFKDHNREFEALLEIIKIRQDDERRKDFDNISHNFNGTKDSEPTCDQRRKEYAPRMDKRSKVDTEPKAFLSPRAIIAFLKSQKNGKKSSL